MPGAEELLYKMLLEGENEGRVERQTDPVTAPLQALPPAPLSLPLLQPSFPHCCPTGPLSPSVAPISLQVGLGAQAVLRPSLCVPALACPTGSLPEPLSTRGHAHCCLSLRLTSATRADPHVGQFSAPCPLEVSTTWVQLAPWPSAIVVSSTRLTDRCVPRDRRGWEAQALTIAPQPSPEPGLGAAP